MAVDKKCLMIEKNSLQLIQH